MDVPWDDREYVVSKRWVCAENGSPLFGQCVPWLAERGL